MDTRISHSPADTVALGIEWGREFQDSCLIGFGGDLGAGKTQLVRGIAMGLGYAGKVHSPTFALINEYSGGRLPMFHLDLYRLNSPIEVEGAGLSQYLLQPEGVVSVEWFEKWEPDIFPKWVHAIESKESGALSEATMSAPKMKFRCRWVWMECLSETQRRIYYEDFGS